MTRAPLRITLDLAQDCGDAVLIGLQLHIRPWKIVGQARVFRFDPDEVRISAGLSVPDALAGVLAPARGNYIKVPSRPSPSWANGPRRSGRPFMMVFRVGMLSFFGPAV